MTRLQKIQVMQTANHADYCLSQLTGPEASRGVSERVEGMPTRIFRLLARVYSNMNVHHGWSQPVDPFLENAQLCDRSKSVLLSLL